MSKLITWTKFSQPDLPVYRALLAGLLFLLLASDLSQPQTEDFVAAQRSYFVAHRLAYFIKPLKFERLDYLKLVMIGTAGIFAIGFDRCFLVGGSVPSLHRMGLPGYPSVRSPPRILS